MTTTLDYVANESPVPPTTLVELFFQGKDDFQGSYRIDVHPFAEERFLVGDLLGEDLKLQSADNSLLDAQVYAWAIWHDVSSAAKNWMRVSTTRCCPSSERISTAGREKRSSR